MEEATFASAHRLFGDRIVRPEEVGKALGADPASLTSADPDLPFDTVPFAPDLLRQAAAEGMMLGLRLARVGGLPLTLLRLASLFPGTSEPPTVDAWFASEPFAKQTCRAGWALFERQTFAASRNLTYAQQNEALSERSRRLGLALRRRTAVEIVYDVLLYAAARGERLLADEWDWSSSVTTDGAFVTAGQFDERGLRLLRYSEAVRFDRLGICATADPPLA
jgi:hypothetical protein